MKKKWGPPCAEFFPCDVHGFEEPVNINDAEVKERLEKAGYKFTKTFQAKKNYIHRSVSGMDVLISVGENIANFNGYIELNGSAFTLWKALEEPSTAEHLESVLEEIIPVIYEKQFTDENGRVYNAENQEKRACSHPSKISGEYQVHQRNDDGSCDIFIYSAQKCTNCGKIFWGGSDFKYTL